MSTSTQCPHGNPTCPCQDGDSCHYEGWDAMICPNPPLGFTGLVNPHCHMEGCEWHVTGCAGVVGKVVGQCGLAKLSPERRAFHLAVPATIQWACGWLRSPWPYGSISKELAAVDRGAR